MSVGIETALADISKQGCKATFCPIPTDGSAEATIAEALKEAWNCIVIGDGVRLPAADHLLFERVVNAVHAAATETPIAFNTESNDSADAVARWLDKKGS